ncbi:MAG: hypothetical protein EA350_04975 [Gemmatimonadales bacterium]|nr:MAG: hypothetical protein EA350_04975 [Gemmatimonadales bacterium]
MLHRQEAFVSNFPASSPSRAPRPRILVPGILVVLIVALAGFGWMLLRPGPEGARPDRLVEASELAPPTPLPPLVSGILHAGDARRVPEGWWVLDRRARLVHFLDTNLRLVGSFGGYGDAPGEFRMPAALGFRGDSLVVLDGGEVPVLHLFGPDAGLVRKESVHVVGCDTFLATGILDAPIEPLHLLGTCTRLLPAPASGSVVVRVEDGGIGHLARGQLQVMNRGFPGAETAVGAGQGETTWVGNSSSPCLDRIGVQHDPTGVPSLCMAEWVGVRFSVDELSARMGRSPGAARLAEILGPMEWLPVMDRVFPHPEGVVLRRLSGLNVRELVHLRPDGSTTLLWSGLPESSWVGGDQVLVAWEGTEGMHLEIRQLHGEAQALASAR